jgi:hypothetical protein
LLPDDPFSGIGILKARLDAGQRPAEDIPGWALSFHVPERFGLLRLIEHR